MHNISNDGLSELKAALRKRASTSEEKSENLNSSEIKENSEPVEPSTEKEEVFVESKIHRKGSKVYKNHGWKYSRSDSCISSTSSQCSVIIKEDVPDMKVKTPEEFEQKTLPVKTISPEEREKFVEQKYNEIIELLSSVGIDVDNL